MRAVPLLVLLLCGLTVSSAPDGPASTEPAGAVTAALADEAGYRALQSEADLALARLRQSVAMAQLAAD